jgi:hypothetical protein
MKKLSRVGVTNSKLVLEKSTLKNLDTQHGTRGITGVTECEATCIIRFCTNSAKCTQPC